MHNCQTQRTILLCAQQREGLMWWKSQANIFSGETGKQGQAGGGNQWLARYTGNTNWLGASQTWNIFSLHTHLNISHTQTLPGTFHVYLYADDIPRNMSGSQSCNIFCVSALFKCDRCLVWQGLYIAMIQPTFKIITTFRTISGIVEGVMLETFAIKAPFRK